jgi:hypothetical protein
LWQVQDDEIKEHMEIKTPESSTHMHLSFVNTANSGPKGKVGKRELLKTQRQLSVDPLYFFLLLNTTSPNSL